MQTSFKLVHCKQWYFDVTFKLLAACLYPQRVQVNLWLTVNIIFKIYHHTLATKIFTLLHATLLRY